MNRMRTVLGQSEGRARLNPTFANFASHWGFHAQTVPALPGPDHGALRFSASARRFVLAAEVRSSCRMRGHFSLEQSSKARVEIRVGSCEGDIAASHRFGSDRIDEAATGPSSRRPTGRHSEWHSLSWPSGARRKAVSSSFFVSQRVTQTKFNVANAAAACSKGSACGPT